MVGVEAVPLQMCLNMKFFLTLFSALKEAALSENARWTMYFHSMRVNHP